MPLPKSFLYLREEDVMQTLDIHQGIELARKGIYADAEGNVVGNKFYTSIGDSGFIKPFTGYINGEQYFFAKTFNFFQDNPAKFDLPATSSLVLVFETETGYPACMMEGAWVTALKTASSTAVTTEFLARENPQTAVVFGAGSLGKMHLRALDSSFDLDKAYVIDLYPEIAQACAEQVGQEVEYNLSAAALEDREEIVRQADIVYTVTTGNQPLVERAWLKNGAFIARLGSYQEITHDVITGADQVIVDNWHYASPRIPEIVHLCNTGEFSFEHLAAEWPDIVAGKKPGRKNQDEVIVYIALGIWGEYAAILPEVYRKALEMGLGSKIPCSYYE